VSEARRSSAELRDYPLIRNRQVVGSNPTVTLYGVCQKKRESFLGLYIIQQVDELMLNLGYPL